MWATEVFVIHQCVGQKRFWMCRRQYGSDPIKNWRTSRDGEGPNLDRRSNLPFLLTESDTPLLREPCPHTRWSGLQIHCKHEGPFFFNSAASTQIYTLSLHARSSPG